MSLAAERTRFIEQLPKAEVHCHLEGAIRHETVFDLAAKHGVDLPFETVTDLRSYYDFESLDHFIDKAGVVGQTIRAADDFERLTVELGADSARQNIPYREVGFGYKRYLERGIAWEDLVAALAAGRERAAAEHGVEVRFIPTIDRTADPTVGVELVERAADAPEDAGFVAIGLASKERGYPAHDHVEAFRRADELGFPTVAHAGEDVGPESVWNALASLDVDRIDHGVRAAEDEMLLEYLERASVPLTTCPVSNVELNVYADLSAHPVAEFLDRGLSVSVNSDDPPMFHADLNENYVRVAETFDLSPDEVVTLAKNSFEATFLDEDRTREYVAEVEAEADRLRTDLDVS